MALNLLAFVAGRQAALNEGVDAERANQLGIVSGILPNPIIGTLIASKIADDETPEPAPARDDTTTTTVFATSAELETATSTLRAEMIAAVDGKVAAVDGKVATVDGKVAAVETKVADLERRVAVLETPAPTPARPGRGG